MSGTEEGLTGDDPGITGDLLMNLDGIEVRESTWAGAYYCAHVLYATSRFAQDVRTSVVRDASGDPLVGFLHVPADAEAAGIEGRLGRARHHNTMRILACALRGVAEELRSVAGERRILVSGFGPFAAVVSNPTGDLVGDDIAMNEVLRVALNAEPQKLEPIAEGDAQLRRDLASQCVLGRLFLDVDDRSLDARTPGSLPWALRQFRPHAVVALGVHRGSSMYRVELEPTSAGLVIDASGLRHERGRPADARGPKNRALARAIKNGATRLQM